MNKADIRKNILMKRDNISDMVKSEWDEIIFERVISTDFYKNSKDIFIFVSFRSEVDTHKIIKNAIKEGKNIYVPKVISKEEGMRAYKINNFEDMQKGYYGILEPKEYCREISPIDIDLVIMPGAAFDKNGGRIGYGGGYYDRFLTLLKGNVKKVALAYKFQVLDLVPMEENDIRVDEIITN
ncbi:MAG: 5-formyltetrahydrofolate cyclo-ligase [Solirubrobacterales bacterium]